MKHILFISIILLGFFACSQDDHLAFDATMPKDNIRFKALPGGAAMYYDLPSDFEIFAINIRYIDSRGYEVLKTGGYGSDSLLIDGFNEARQKVSARVSLVNNRNEESAPFEVTFDTQDSAPYAFFNTAEVSSYWGGFQVIYNTPERVSGMAHVLYLGTNPLTQQEDTILLKSFPINKGGDTLRFLLQQARNINTVVVRTEDYRGYRVRQKIWKDVESFYFEKWNLSEKNFFVGDLSIENEEACTGVNYLFNGDTKGEQRLKNKKMEKVFTFVAGPNALGKPFIIDLNEKKIPASIRMYGILNLSVHFVGGSFGPLGTVWEGLYTNKLPCEVTVYAGNEKEGTPSSWTKIGYFYQHPATKDEDRWTWSCSEWNWDGRISTPEMLAAADPAYLEILFPATPERYRYLKFIVHDTFDYRYPGLSPNIDNYFTIQELEVYVKKD
ncbi:MULTISPECIES: DUF4959 domain-containing protein [Sanguibacteroides]|uniref:DUF4959 domain-containing protein n=1 Tax=Sanguibacteroides justesenii TaxID=1547597 RepID=A0AB34R4T2_9PORP|nr:MULTISPECIES: DUF4959 domain-containing protein [Sanguibacteroides]KIO45200.1 hypothetical protein IE90_07155 [Sanguibacteroides justesenii]